MFPLFIFFLVLLSSIHIYSCLGFVYISFSFSLFFTFIIFAFYSILLFSSPSSPLVPLPSFLSFPSFDFLSVTASHLSLTVIPLYLPPYVLSFLYCLPSFLHFHSSIFTSILSLLPPQPPIFPSFSFLYIYLHTTPPSFTASHLSFLLIPSPFVHPSPPHLPRLSLSVLPCPLFPLTSSLASHHLRLYFFNRAQIVS